MKTHFVSVLIMLALVAGLPIFKAAAEERNLPAFTELSLRIPARVYVTQGKEQSVKVVAKESVMDKIITEVKGRELIIRKPVKDLVKGDVDLGKVEIFITIPQITKLSSAGSGFITNDGAIETTIIDLIISGSGNITIDNLRAERVNTVISGSGHVQIAGDGEASQVNISASGSGRFKGLDFKAQDVDIKLSGSGNIEVHAVNNLKVRASGSGNISYKGRPLVDQTTSGSSRVKSVQ